MGQANLTIGSALTQRLMSDSVHLGSAPSVTAEPSQRAAGNKRPSPGSQSSQAEGGSLPVSQLPQKPVKPNKARSQLRKGKWTVCKARLSSNYMKSGKVVLSANLVLLSTDQLEEEEYTSRIIHYFSTGLLSLPEGSTLRSYLAEKLNCDPMRVTKKYAGAACLGRRAYHLRDRPQPTVADIQLAKTQLDELERRFRMRVEEGYSTSTSGLLSAPGPLAPVTASTLPAVTQQLSPHTALLQNLLFGVTGAPGVQAPTLIAPRPAAGGPAPWGAPAPSVPWIIPTGVV